MTCVWLGRCARGNEWEVMTPWSVKSESTFHRSITICIARLQPLSVSPQRAWQSRSSWGARSNRRRRPMPSSAVATPPALYLGIVFVHIVYHSAGDAGKWVRSIVSYLVSQHCDMSAEVVSFRRNKDTQLDLELGGVIWSDGVWVCFAVNKLPPAHHALTGKLDAHDECHHRDACTGRA